jgi:hypothetical protein
MLCQAQSPNLHCSHLVAYTPYQEQKSKEKNPRTIDECCTTAWAEEVEGSGDGGALVAPTVAGLL